MSLKFPDGSPQIELDTPKSIQSLRDEEVIPRSAGVCTLGEPELLSNGTILHPGEIYFVLPRPTELSPMLQRIVDDTTIDTLLTMACCFRFRSTGPIRTRESLRSILIELRGLGVDAFCCSPPRKLNIRPQLTPYPWDCCADCDTYGECNNDDFDWTPYEDSMEDRLDKERPYSTCPSELWIMTFPLEMSKFSEECKIVWGIIPYREGKQKKQTVRQNNKFQLEITNSDGEPIKTVCAAHSSERKKVSWKFVGPMDHRPITREILESSKSAIDASHQHYDNITGQLDQMLARV